MYLEHLTSEETGELDSNLVQTFLATYRTFTDTSTVIKTLRQRYEKILPASLEMTEDVRLEHLKSIRCILRMWLESYNEDFNDPREYLHLNELNKFAHDHLTESDLIKLIRAKFEFYESLNNKNNSNNTEPAMAHSNNEKKLSMSDLNLGSVEDGLNQKRSNHRRCCSNSNVIGDTSSPKSSLNASKSSLGEFEINKETTGNSAGLFKFFTNKKNTQVCA